MAEAADGFGDRVVSIGEEEELKEDEVSERDDGEGAVVHRLDDEAVGAGWCHGSSSRCVR